MTHELTNLLPPSRSRGFRRRYFLRLATVLLVSLSFAVALHGVLLLPTYLYVRSEGKREAAELSALGASAQTSEEQAVASRAALLKGTAAYLSKFATAPAMSAALRAVLAVPRPSISLTGFTYTAPAAANAPARMQVSGIAASRDALRSYVTALGQLPFVTSADLPISAYAKERDIDFTVTLTGSLRP